MDEQAMKLEVFAEKTVERLSALERDVAMIKANYATKADIAEVKAELKIAIAEAKTSMILWVVSAVFLAQPLPALLKRFGL